MCTRSARRRCPCHCEGHESRAGCRTDALANARVRGMVGIHTHWCVPGKPGVSVLATARVRCVGLGATRMPLPLRGSSAWPGYTPAGVCEGGPVGVPARRGQEEVSLQLTKAPLQLSTAWLLVKSRATHQFSGVILCILLGTTLREVVQRMYRGDTRGQHSRHGND